MSKLKVTAKSLEADQVEHEGRTRPSSYLEADAECALLCARLQHERFAVVDVGDMLADARTGVYPSPHRETSCLIQRIGAPLRDGWCGARGER